MGMVDAFIGILTKQQLLPGCTSEILQCYHRAGKFGAKSELDTKSVDLQVGEMTSSSGKDSKYLPCPLLGLRAL